jgi:hypothetical protein
MAVRPAVKRARQITWPAVEKIGLALPDVESGTSWGAPALKVRGQMFVCLPTHKSAEPDSIVVRIDFPQRDELVAGEPDVYYLKEHYVDYACVLVRMKRVHADALRDLIGMAWRFVSAKTVRRRSANPLKKRTSR